VTGDASGQSSPLVDYWIASSRAEFSRLTVRSLRGQAAFEELLTEAMARTNLQPQCSDSGRPT
jgi:hypothetical protein